MSGPMPPVVVNFEQDVVKIIAGSRQILNKKDDPKFAAELGETAPSLIASKACDVHEVVVKVRRGSDLWSPQLESDVRAEVATHKSPIMADVRLKVVPY